MKTRIVILCLVAMITITSCADHYCPTYSRAGAKPGTVYKYKKKI